MKNKRTFRSSAWFGMVALAMLVVSWGCSGEAERSESEDRDEATAVEDSTDMERIQAMFGEVATRLNYGDAGVLLDLEFEYLQDKVTYDMYIGYPQVKYLLTNPPAELIVKEVELVDDDMAMALVEAVFVSLSGDITQQQTDSYRLYRHRGRWIHPTVSKLDLQMEHDELRRVADSAAAAEAELGDY